MTYLERRYPNEFAPRTVNRNMNSTDQAIGDRTNEEQLGRYAALMDDFHEEQLGRYAALMNDFRRENGTKAPVAVTATPLHRRATA